jgi:hypothetical protein
MTFLTAKADYKRMPLTSSDVNKKPIFFAKFF